MNDADELDRRHLNSRTACADIARARPDAALIDYDLPDGNGLDLARALIFRQPSLRIVITSSDSTALREDAAGGTIRGFVAKERLSETNLAALFD